MTSDVRVVCVTHGLHESVVSFAFKDFERLVHAHDNPAFADDLTFEGQRTRQRGKNERFPKQKAASAQLLDTVLVNADVRAEPSGAVK
jgi:hypothetical protein